MTITKARRILAGTTKRLAEAVRASRKDIAAIEARNELTGAAKQLAITARRDELRAQVDAIEEGAKEAAEAVRTSAPASPAVDPLEAMRIWQRQERELRGGANAGDIASRLAAEGNRLGLQVLGEELPAYMRSTGEGDYVDGLIGEVRAAEGPLLTEEESAYRANVAEVDAALQRVVMNTGLTRIDGETAGLLIGVGDEPNIDLTKED